MSSYIVSQLLEKMRHADQDFRFMALQDLQGEVRKPAFSIDGNTEERTVDQVLLLMKDNNTEVKNHAVKTIGVLSTRVQEPRLVTMIDQLTLYTADKDEQLRDIANLGLRTVIRDVPVDARFGELVCNSLAPRLLDQLRSAAASPDAQLGCTELLADLFARFDASVRAHLELQTSSVQALVPLLTNVRAAVRKRAVDALGFLTASSTEDVINTLLSQTVVPELNATGDGERLKTGIGLVGAMAARAPHKIGSRLHELVPKIIAATTARDDDDLREAGLQTLERVILRCPREAAPFVPQISELATNMLKHDPNYEGLDEDDEQMDVADEEDDEDFAEDYEDDDDISWKVRRAATKLFAAIIETRPELLASFFRTISPMLIARFGEREESVRIEIWQTYTKLLLLARIYGESPSQAHDSPSLKRKRDDGGMRVSPVEVDESPTTMLRQQAPLLLTSLMKQLSNKSLPARLAGFSLLRSLIEVMHGGLDDHIAVLVARIDASLLSADTGASSGSATALKIEILGFLGRFFALHSPSLYEPYLNPTIVPRLMKTMVDKYNRVAAEAFNTAAALVRQARPVPTQAETPESIAQALRSIYDVTIMRLSPGAVTDQDVRESALKCLGEVLYHAGDEPALDLERALGLLRAAVQRETTRQTAVHVAGHVAQSPVCVGKSQFSAWAQTILVDVAQLLRQISRPLRLEAFGALPPLIMAAGGDLGPDAINAILSNIQPYLAEDDAHLIPSALSVATSLITTCPDVGTSSNFTRDIIPRVQALAKSPITHGAALESLLHFFQALVRAGLDPQTLCNELIAAGNTPLTPNGPLPAYQTIARCLGAVIVQAPQLADQISKTLMEQMENQKALVFSLLAIGQIGRLPNIPQRQQAFEKAHAFFDAQAEEVRLAASMAVGNLVVGASENFLPVLVTQIQEKDVDDRRRTLALAAIKEYIVHTSAAALVPSAESLWDPLLAICAVDGPPAVESKPASMSVEESKARDKRVALSFKASEPLREQWKKSEASRTMATECIGKITLANPHRYLPKLQARLEDKMAGIRAAAVSAVRFTFTDESAALDEMLASAFVSFMSPMRDTDLDVRRLALSTLNSAAHHKPQLVRPHVPTLSPMLFDEMSADPSLIRIVEMGPYKHKVDDGLDVRKAAYETSYTLLDTCLAKVDTHELLNRVIVGMTDDNEIRAISYLILIRLAAVSPAAVVQRLDTTAELFDKTFSEELKADTVKQDKEKHQQMQRAALRTFATLSKLANPAATPKFSSVVNKIATHRDWAIEFKMLRSEVAINGDAMEVD